MNAQPMISRKYTCPSTNKPVLMQIKQTGTSTAAQRRAGGSVRPCPESCSNIAECGVVKIIDGISYRVDWNQCSLYSSITEQ